MFIQEKRYLLRDHLDLLAVVMVQIQQPDCRRKEGRKEGREEGKEEGKEKREKERERGNPLFADFLVLFEIIF